MDSDMDDLDVLYGDLDDRVNAGIFLAQENQYSCSAVRNPSSSKPGKFVSIGEEHSSDDRIGEAYERPVASIGKKEWLDFGAEGSGNNSDKEDDLHLVLNEEDRLKFPPSRRADVGCGGEVVGEGEKDKDNEDLLILYGSDCLQKDQKWGDQLSSPTDGIVHGSAERGSAAKGSYHCWHEGYNLEGFSYGGETSMPGRGDGDHLMMPSSGGAALCNFSIPASAQNGYNFTLPQSRTIFDINTAAFEQKPWRQPGVDITDYFNFGLDEDSWKSYCQQLDQFRQQVAMSTQFPNYNLSRLNEPKGGAIQVESGDSECIPSIDLRWLRHRDPGVVIQIATDDSMENASVPCEGELKHAEQGLVDCSMIEYKNEPNEGMLSLDHVSLVRSYPEVAETNLKGAAEEVADKLDYTKGDREDSLRVDDSLMKAEFASEFQLMHRLSSCDLDSHSEASKDSGCSKKIHGAIRNKSLDSVTGLQEPVRPDSHLSNDSRIIATKTKIEDVKGNTYDRCLIPEGHKGCSRSGQNIMAELNIATENDQASIQSSRKCQSDVDPFEVSHGTSERKCDPSTNIVGHLSSNKKTKMSVSCKSRKYVEKHASERSSTKSSHKKGEKSSTKSTYKNGEKSATKSSHKKGDHDNHLTRNQDKREQRVAGRESALKHREHCSHEWHHDDQGERVVHHGNSGESISECGSFFLGKASNMGHKRKRENEHLIQMDAVNYNSIIEHGYREKHVQETHRRQVAKCDTEEGIFDHKFHRPAPDSGVEERTAERRDKHDESSCYDLYGSNRCTKYHAKKLRHLDETCEHHVEDERGHHDTSPLRSHLYGSCRLRKKFMDHRKHFATREMESRCKKYECHFVPGSKDGHHSIYEIDNKFHDDDHITKERGTYIDDINRKKRCDQLAKPRLDTDDKVSFRHRDPDLSSQEKSFLHERSSKNEKSLVNQHLVGGRKFSGDCLLGNTGKEIINERTQRSATSDAREHNKFVLHNFDKGSHEVSTLGCREAVNVHLNDVKTKFRKRGNKVTVKSEIHIDVTRTIDKELKASEHTEEICMLGVPSHVPKSEGAHRRPTVKSEIQRVVTETIDEELKDSEQIEEVCMLEVPSHVPKSEETHRRPTVKSEIHRDVTETLDEELKASEHIEEVCMLEVPSHVPKSEGTHRRPTRKSEIHRDVTETIDEELKASEHIEKVCMLEVPSHVPKSEGTHRRPTAKSEIHRNVTVTLDEELKAAEHIEEVCMLEVPSHVPKSEGTHRRPTSWKEKVKESEHSDDHYLKKCEDKHPISQDNDDDEIEDGHLSGETKDQHVDSMTGYWNSEKKVAFLTVEASRSAHLDEKNSEAKESTPDNKVLGGYDSNQMLETLAKMERRRERFKDPIALKPGPEKTLKPQLVAAAYEAKQQRPARKRRWGGTW